MRGKLLLVVMSAFMMLPTPVIAREVSRTVGRYTTTVSYSGGPIRRMCAAVRARRQAAAADYSARYGATTYSVGYGSSGQTAYISGYGSSGNYSQYTYRTPVVRYATCSCGCGCPECDCSQAEEYDGYSEEWTVPATTPVRMRVKTRIQCTGPDCPLSWTLPQEAKEHVMALKAWRLPDEAKMAVVNAAGWKLASL